MNFALLVRGPSATALAFAQSALSEGHRVTQIFFQGDGVHQANRLSAPPAAERAPVLDWSSFGRDFGVDLVLCSSSGLRRGVREANLAPGFRISGLGQWLDAAAAADRVVSFGG